MKNFIKQLINFEEKKQKKPCYKCKRTDYEGLHHVFIDGKLVEGLKQCIHCLGGKSRVK